MAKKILVYRQATVEVAALVVYLLLLDKDFELLPFDAIASTKARETIQEALPPLPNIQPSVIHTGIIHERGVIPDKYKPNHKRRK